MRRRTDWMTQLMAAVDTAQVLPFSYGLHDCCTFAAHCVDAMCDSEVLRKIQRTHPYRSETEAHEYIALHGGLVGLVSAYLGAALDNPLFAAPGDVVVARDVDNRELVGVVIGHNVVAPGQGGLRTLPVTHALAAWKV